MISKSIGNFRSAQDVEKTKNWLGNILALKPGEIWYTVGGSLKPAQFLPRFYYHSFVIEPSVRIMLLARAMNLKLHYYYELLGYQKLEKESLPERLLRIVDAEVSTYVCLIKAINKALASAPLTVGTEGMLSFPKHEEWGIWSFRIGRLPSVASNEEAFAVITVGKQTPKFSCQPVKEAILTSSSSMKQLLDGMKYENVKPKVRISDVTEQQQWKALKLINQLATSETTGSTKDVSGIVCPILAGHGIKNIGRKSYYSDGFVTKQMARIEDIHRTFAAGISKDGARISDEQLMLCFGYLSSTPADRLALVNGPAGTRKSSSLGLIISFLCLDNLENKGKIFLVLGKMHSTQNNMAKSLGPIVKGFTGRVVVREFSDALDMAVMTWMVNGQPKYLDPEFTKGLEADELQELRDLMVSVSQVSQTPGTSIKAPESAIHLMAIYCAMCDMEMDVKHWRKSNYHFQGDAPSSTKRSSADRDDDAEGGPSKVRKGHSAEKTPIAEASETPQGWQGQLKQLERLVIRKLQKGASKAEDKKMMALLYDTKVLWIKEKACVVCTTISRCDSQEIMDLGVSYVALEESQFVDPHDSTVLMAHYAKNLKIFIGDVMQPSPFVKDGPFNSFSCVRGRSTFEL